MNVAQRKPWSIAEFLVWEERQGLRYEFDGIQPVAMVGGTAAHNIIVQNLSAPLRERLRGTSCRAFTETVKVEVAGRIRYPDLVVTCTPVAANATVIPAPVVIFEVLSDSTAQGPHRKERRIPQNAVDRSLHHGGTALQRRTPCSRAKPVAGWARCWALTR